MWPVGTVNNFTTQIGKSRGQSLRLLENGWKFSEDHQAMAAKFTFSRRSELFSIVCPEDRPFIEAWHVSEPGFGARVMRENKRNGRTLRTYLCRYSNLDGKDTKEALGQFDEVDYDDAQQTVRDKRRMRNAPDSVKALRKMPTLKEALETHMSERVEPLADVTILDYRKKWNYLQGMQLYRSADDEAKRKVADTIDLERTRLGQIDAEQWLSIITRVARNSGRTTAVMLYRTAHAVYETFVNLEYLGRNPLRAIPKKFNIRPGEKRTRILTADELPKVWNWLQLQAQPVTRDFIMVALFAGLRNGSIGGLRWEDVDPERRTYILPADAYGNKAKVKSEVPIPDLLWERVFAPRLASRMEGQEWVIASSKRIGGPAVNVRGGLEGMHTMTGVHCTPHMLRHTFGSLAQLATGDSMLVSRMLTHRSGSSTKNTPAVTAGYIHYQEDELRAGFNKTAALIFERCMAGTKKDEEPAQAAAPAPAPTPAKKAKAKQTA